MSNISFNPLITTTAAGSFSVQSDGYVQGTMLDDPAVRFALAGGILAATETLPMWGGVAITESIPVSSGNYQLGSGIARALTAATITGFSVFNQASNWVTTPQSECPSAGNGMTVPFFRFGSGARVALQCDPALVSLDGGLTTQQVSWDFDLQRVIPYYAVQGPYTISAMTWSAGVVTVTTSTANTFASGDDVVIAGTTPAAYNGSQTITVLSTTQFTFALATNPGAVTVLGQVLAGGGAVPIRILNVNIGNSKIVTYDAVNNLVHWSNAGSTLVALL